MTMLLRKEVWAIVRDGRLVTLAVALLVILAGALHASSLREHEQTRERTEIERITRQQWDNQGHQPPHRGAHFGIYVFQPKAPLSVIDPGILDYVGQALWLEPHRRNFMRFRPAVDAPPHTRLGLPTPAFLLTSTLPLLIIGFAFNAVSEERESGTLRMLHGAGLAPVRLIVAKLAAQLGVLALWLIFLLAVTWVVFVQAPPDGDALLRTAALGIGYLLYYLTFCALALAASTLFRHSRTALLTLIVIWALFALVVPRLGSAVASAGTPLPTAEQFWTQIRHDYEHGLPGDLSLADQVAQFEAEQLRQNGVGRVEDLPFGINAVRRLFRDAYSDKVHTHHFERLGRAHDAQTQALRWTALFSPSLAMQAFSATLAGTDMAHQRHFEHAAEAYRRYINTTIDRWDADNTHGVSSFDARYADNQLWRAIKPFEYHPPDAAFAWRAAWPDLLTLLGWSTLATALLIILGRRLTP